MPSFVRFFASSVRAAGSGGRAALALLLCLVALGGVSPQAAQALTVRVIGTSGIGGSVNGSDSASYSLDVPDAPVANSECTVQGTGTPGPWSGPNYIWDSPVVSDAGGIKATLSPDPANKVSVSLNVSFLKPGDYTIQLTGHIAFHSSCGDAAGQDTKTIDVHVGGKVWKLGDPIQGGDLVKPANQQGPLTKMLNIEQNASMDLELSQATDTDHWTQGTDQGDEDDNTLTYKWTADDGVFSSPNGRTTKWTAPSLPDGEDHVPITITGEVDNDNPPPLGPGETGKRNDEAVTHSFTIMVTRPKWDSAPAIGQHRDPNTKRLVPDGRMIAPQDQRGNYDSTQEVSVAPGAHVSCEVEGATDLDTLTPVNGDPSEVPDEVNYTWSAIKEGTGGTGHFEWQVVEDGQTITKTGDTAPTASATWVAPDDITKDSKFTLACTIDDKPGKVNEPAEGGKRDDKALVRTVNIKVTPLKVDSQKDSLVAGGVRVGRYYESAEKNPHQTEITATLAKVAGQDIRFEIVPDPNAQENEMKAGFALRDEDILVFDTTVKTDADGKARVVLTSGSHVGSVTVRMTAGKTSQDKTFSIEKAKGKWSATPVDPDSDDDPIVRLSLQYNDLPVNGHAISWTITHVTLPTGKVVPVRVWNDYVRFTGVSSAGETISTTGAHGTPGEAAAYAHFSLALSQIDFDGQDTQIIPQKVQDPPAGTPQGEVASQSASSESLAMTNGGQRHEQTIKLENLKRIIRPVLPPLGDFRPRMIRGTGANTNNVLGSAEERALVRQGYSDSEIRVPFGVEQHITLDFRVVRGFRPTVGGHSLESVTVQTRDVNGDLLQYTRNLKTGVEAMTVNGQARLESVDPIGSVKYFFDYFAPALADAWVDDNYTVHGKVGQARRVYVTVKNLGIGFYNGGKGAVALGAASIDAQLHPVEAWSKLQIGIRGFRDDKIRQKLIAKLKQDVSHDYDLMYSDAVTGDGEKFAAFAGEQGGEWMFNEVLGFGIGKAATLGKSAIKGTNLYTRAGEKVARIADIAVSGAITNTGRIKEVIAPVVNQVSHIGKFTWTYAETHGESVAAFTKKALASPNARISCYLKAAGNKASGYVVLVRAESGILGYKLKVPCRYARIFGEIDPATKRFKARAIELLVEFVCFPKGTPIALPNHQFKPIERIRIGDRVMSRDEFTGQTSIQRVVNVFRKHTDDLVRLRLSNGETIRATPEHPFYVFKRGFTPAKLLRAGTLLATLNGHPAKVVKNTLLHQQVPVFNFEVENTHTYFVGHSALWVHNLCKARWVSFIYDGNGGVFEKAIDHIFNRHNIQSAYPNVSKFFSSYSNKSNLKALISDAVWKSTSADIISTTRTGDIRLVYDFGYNIGTTTQGITTSKLEIYMTALGEVRTAYPVR